MQEIITRWKLGRVEAKASKEGLEVNGRTIPWQEIEEAKRKIIQSEFYIPIIGTAK